MLYPITQSIHITTAVCAVADYTRSSLKVEPQLFRRRLQYIHHHRMKRVKFVKAEMKKAVGKIITTYLLWQVFRLAMQRRYHLLTQVVYVLQPLANQHLKINKKYHCYYSSGKHLTLSHARAPHNKEETTTIFYCVSS